MVGLEAFGVHVLGSDVLGVKDLGYQAESLAPEHQYDTVIVMNVLVYSRNRCVILRSCPRPWANHLEARPVK